MRLIFAPFIALVLAGSACGSSSSSEQRHDAGSSVADVMPAVADGAHDVSASDLQPIGPNDSAVTPDAGTVAESDSAVDLAVAEDIATPDAAEDVTPDAEEQPDAAPDAVAMCGHILCDCTYKGKNLFGDMAYVTDPPYDFKVEVVTNGLADLYVQEVTNAGLATRCGQWKTDAFVPKFRVLKVTSPAISDFRIQYDSLLPGIPGQRF